MLLKHSDEEHPVTLGQLQEELERWDAPAERKSIYEDMEQLRQLGLDVQARRGAGGGWFVGQREFELAASWSPWPRSTKPGSSSGRCMWTGALRP